MLSEQVQELETQVGTNEDDVVLWVETLIWF